VVVFGRLSTKASIAASSSRPARVSFSDLVMRLMMRIGQKIVRNNSALLGKAND
jgi:hypothetical protein